MSAASAVALGSASAVAWHDGVEAEVLSRPSVATATASRRAEILAACACAIVCRTAQPLGCQDIHGDTAVMSASGIGKGGFK